MTREELQAIRDRVYGSLTYDEDGKPRAPRGMFHGFHEKAARAYAAHGRTEDAEAARRLAEKTRV